MPEYSKHVKEMSVNAAIKLMARAGCNVSECRNGNSWTIMVDVPEDSADPHGDRLMKALDAQGK